jgi:LacI family transcriptional regulator
VVDVAREAGVSIGTVSRVLNNSPHPVNVATRERVLRAMATLDFQPNALARGLSGGRTQTLGVVVHDITDDYFNQIVRGIDDVADPAGYLVMVLSSYRDADKELDYVRRLRGQRCDGIIFVGGGLQVSGHAAKVRKQLEAIENDGGAVVMLAPNDLPWPSIVPDGETGIRLLVDHLVSLGHHRFAMLTGPAHLRTSVDRAAAFEAAFRDHGIDLDPDLVISAGFDRARAVDVLTELAHRDLSFTAVVCLNDQMAVGCLQAAKRLGLDVPTDLSVSGIDDLPVTELLDPPLTTVRVPMRELGRRGMQLLLDRLERRDVPRSATVPCDLIVRRSTAPPPPDPGTRSLT